MTLPHGAECSHASRVGNAEGAREKKGGSVVIQHWELGDCSERVLGHTKST